MSCNSGSNRHAACQRREERSDDEIRQQRDQDQKHKANHDLQPGLQHRKGKRIVEDGDVFGQATHAIGSREASVQAAAASLTAALLSGERASQAVQLFWRRRPIPHRSVRRFPPLRVDQPRVDAPITQ